ncbi:MAG: conjugal transfer protein, partial [Oscillospiraceae bacterium]|nr:conjugal transfer protein [Oscillospiraceae bacterium]
WAEIRGMRDSEKMIADLEAGGITSLNDLRGFFWNFKHPDDHTDELTELDKKIRGIDKLINMMKQHSQNYATYKEYQERSAFTQKSFRKKNAAAIDAFEEADKYIAEHIKAYYIKGKPPKQSDLQAKSTKLKEKFNALVPEHNAYVTKRDTAHKYTRQVRNYLQNKEQQERNRQYQEKKRSQQKRKDTLE